MADLPPDGWRHQQHLGAADQWAEAMRPFTDFGDRSVVIARRVSWSPDNKFLYAAVAETDADIVVLAGLLDDLQAA